MPLFGLGEIRFDKNPEATKGPLASLYESKHKTNTLKYPLDVGSPDKGHYMLIYINKQISSQLQDGPEENATSQALSGLGGSNINTAVGSEVGNFVSNQAGKIDALTGSTVASGIASAGSNIVSGAISGVKNIIGGLGTNKARVLSGNGAATQSIISRNVKSLQLNGGKLSQTKHTGDVIALYMPDTLNFGFTQNYDQLSLTSNMAGLVGTSVAEQIKSGIDAKKLQDAALAIASAKGAGLGDIGRAGAFLGIGAVVNPMLEIIYNSPSFRSFDYIFKFYPRSEREAIEVQKIINMLQYHQAPEIKKDGSTSLLIPPSEFDIKFYYAGKENDNIPKIGSCVLRNIQVNYAPGGWSAYEVPGQDATLGGTGMPVGIEMSLSFQEVTYITKHISQVSESSLQMSAAWNETGAVNEKGEGLV